MTDEAVLNTGCLRHHQGDCPCSSEVFAKREDLFRTDYCGYYHVLADGTPVEHKCRNLPVAMLKAEKEGDLVRAREEFYAWDTSWRMNLIAGRPCEEHGLPGCGCGGGF